MNSTAALAHQLPKKALAQQTPFLIADSETIPPWSLAVIRGQVSQT